MSLSIFVVVSKDPDVRRLAQRYGQEVYGADDLDTVQTVIPDLVLFDHRFGPGQIGDFLDKADKKIAAVPIVAVGSAGDDTGSSAEYLQAGAFGYLQTSKDYRQMELIIDRIENTSEVAGPDPACENLCSMAGSQEHTQDASLKTV